MKNENQQPRWAITIKEQAGSGVEVVRLMSKPGLMFVEKHFEGVVGISTRVTSTVTNTWPFA